MCGVPIKNDVPTQININTLEGKEMKQEYVPMLPNNPDFKGDSSYHVEVQADNLPAYKRGFASSRNAQNNFLVNLTGGLGDVVCAEPAIRWAIKNFKSVGGVAPTWTICTRYPHFFGHFEYPIKVCGIKDIEDPGKYLVFNNQPHPHHLQWEFYNQSTTNPVDFASLSLFGVQIPGEKSKVVKGVVPPSDIGLSIGLGVEKFRNERLHLIHPGYSFPSKSFGFSWWYTFIAAYAKFLREINHETNVVLIGHCAVSTNKGAYNFKFDKKSGIINLVGKTTMSELNWLLARATNVVSNDSAPIHIAQINANSFNRGKRIYVIDTCKNAEYLKHTRYSNVFGLKDVWKGCIPMWEQYNLSPANLEGLNIKAVPEGNKIHTYLPDPTDYARAILTPGTPK